MNGSITSERFKHKDPEKFKAFLSAGAAAVQK
jgi:hypothetical protein